MTKINKIVIHGFKSFAKRTELTFDDNFNIILGPNGSGKSNVLDGICFVLGKSSTKSLRAEKSANLIYNGGKTKEPAKQGEVSIYFDNSKKIFPTEEKIVKLTRIVKPNGMSVYKINDKTRTRQQVLDLMSVAKINPDGYNIILQGDITRFAEMSPVERREVVEEIAGISVYEEKKRKALLELEKVQERLKEAEIVLLERSTYLKELKKDRDEAMKFKDLKEKIAQNKASYLNIQIQEKLKEKKKYDDALTENKEKIEKLQKQINELKKQITEKKEKIEEINKRIEGQGESEQLKIHKAVEELKVGLETDRQRVNTCQNEITRINSRKEQLENNLKEIDAKIKDLSEEKSKSQQRTSLKEKEQKEIEAKIEKFKQKHKLVSTTEIEKKIDSIEKEADEKQKEIQTLREEQQNLLREKDKLEYQFQSIDERVKKVMEVKKESKEQIENLKNKKEEFKKSTLELNKLLSEDSSLAVQLGNSREKFLKSEEELAKLNARNIGLKERISGQVSVQKILEQKNTIKGIHGTIAELGNVGSRYSLALEVAAGPRLNSVVVDNDATAAKCIKFLKEKKLGTATFLPLNKIKPTETIKDENKKLAKSTGCHGFAIELINFDSKFKNAFSYIFGNTIVVDDIDVTRRIGIGEIRMVTVDGDLVERSGAMHGGYRTRKGMGFKENELTSEILGIEKNIIELKNLIKVFENRKKENEKKIYSLRESKAILEGEIIKLEKSLHLEEGDLDASKRQKQIISQQVEALNKKIDGIQDRTSNINKALANLKIEKQELKAKISELRDPTLIAELNTFEQKKQELREEILEINGSLKNIDTQINDIYNRDKENTQKILKQQDKEAESFKKEIEKLKEETMKKQKSLTESEKKEKEFYGKFKSLFSQKSKIGDELQEIETKGIAKEEEIRTVEHKNNTYSIENARLNAELTALQEDFKQYTGVKLLTNKTREELKKGISDFEKMVDNIGSVNMRALEVYEKIEKEHQELVGKKEKLASEKDDVIGMMNEIETKKKDLFANTFSQIKKNFMGIFNTLTTKGEAHLELEVPENPFEGGITFKVRISGNKFLDIRGLSGGEKTLTALAFIFAIQEYEPASFYVLDEVDAALDKHNSEKLGKLIQKYSQNAQYIVISHNDAIITEGNTLYGVSMNEHGMSNIVSLKV